MNNSYCSMGYECGAFAESCTEEKSANCMGRIKPNDASRERYDKIVLPPPEKFFWGVCSILGEKAMVAFVNESTKACKNCWRGLIASRRSSGSADDLSPQQKQKLEELKRQFIMLRNKTEEVTPTST